MLSTVKNILRWCKTTKKDDGAAAYPIQQVGYLGKVADALIVLPYGFACNVPNDTLALMMAVQASEGNRAVIPLSGPDRPQLKQGEVAIFNQAGTYVKLLQDGSIEISANSVTVKGNLTVEGDTALGANVTSNSINIGSTHTHSGVTTGGGVSGPPV